MTKKTGNEKPSIEVTVGDKTLAFNVSDSDVNQYLNNQMPNEKVQSAYNFLVGTVAEKDKDALKAVALSGATPRGIIVVQLATMIAGQFGGELEISIKKPSNASSE